MNDLISRQDAIDALTEANIRKHSDSLCDGGQENRSAIRIIMELPSAEHHKLNIAEYIHDFYPDVWRHAEKELEVHPETIRCRDCAYNFGNENFCEYNPEDIVCTYFETDGLHADDFCSRGKEQ